jgi:hypothetical protein
MYPSVSFDRDNALEKDITLRKNVKPFSAPEQDIVRQKKVNLCLVERVKF